MVLEIVWSPEAVSTYISTLEYLEREWTVREMNNFISRVNEKISILKFQPFLGRVARKRKNVYITVINKRVTLVYQYQPVKKQIELITFWNTLKNPKNQKW